MDTLLKRPESALVVVHTATKALVIKRTDHDCFWQSITGTLEWGESAYEAGLRELTEETGIIAKQLRTTGIIRNYEILPQWRYRYPADIERNREHLFYCEVDNQSNITLDPKEHSEYQWLPFDQATKLVWSWSNKLALMAL